jgi:hypothetical protein
MKKNLLFMAFIMCCLNPLAQAGVRSLYLDKSELLLQEKIGKTDNLLDNPARLSELKNNIFEYDFNIGVQDIKPYDAVYKKINKEETMRQVMQIVVPVEDWCILNAGHEYKSAMAGSESTSRLDATEINDLNKTFNKKVNFAVATARLPFGTLGYAGSSDEQEHYNDFHSDLAEDYTYLNAKSTLRHTVGVMIEGFELFGSLDIQSFGGYYQHEQEVDFSITDMEINARYLIGAVDQNNLLLQLGYTGYQLEQRQFILGRAGYELDIPNRKISGSAYYYYPVDGLELAVGAEADFWEKDIFVMRDYAWQTYQVIRGTVPMQVGVAILPYLKVWLESDLVYLQNTYAGSRSLTWQNTLGVQLKLAEFEVQLYTLPSFSLAASNTSDAGQTMTVGVRALVRF